MTTKQKWLIEIEWLRGKHDPLNERIAAMMADIEDMGWRRGHFAGMLSCLAGSLLAAGAIRLLNWVLTQS